MTFCSFNKDNNSWIADVQCVCADMKKATQSHEVNETCIKFEYEGTCYHVTAWYHQEPKYARYLAIAKDNSHCVTWCEKHGEIHRW